MTVVIEERPPVPRTPDSAGQSGPRELNGRRPRDPPSKHTFSPGGRHAQSSLTPLTYYSSVIHPQSLPRLGRQSASRCWQ